MKTVFLKLQSTILAIFLVSFWLIPTATEGVLVGNTNNATLSLNPQSGIYKVGTTFSIDINVNTAGQSVVAVAAYLTFNPALFEVVSIDTTNSVFSLEAEKTIDNVNGKVKITRGQPTPGVNTANGKVATVMIKGKSAVSPVSDNFNFDFTAGASNDSNVILNNALGTDILSGVYNGRYTLDATPPANVSNFTATAGDAKITLQWTNPSTLDFAAVRIVRKTVSYPTTIDDGTIIYEGSATTYTDSSLTNGTTYYYKAFSRDAVFNYSSGVQASATPRDSLPPAQINDLTATVLSSNSVRLNWTAVGDDAATGTASSYDIRYFTSPITSTNWNSATQFSATLTPKIAGTPESVVVTDLTADTVYYFAVRAIDESNNISPLSNIANAKTLKSADFNNDGFVNSIDFGILMSYWGSTQRPSADLNQDGVVNSVDFGILLSQWG
ncbi:MAG: fibronectin type III domain-containing protein [Nitrososphaerota archaeon]